MAQHSFSYEHPSRNTTGLFTWCEMELRYPDVRFYYDHIHKRTVSESSKGIERTWSEKCELNYKISAADTKSSGSSKKKGKGMEKRCEGFPLSLMSGCQEGQRLQIYDYQKLLKEPGLIFFFLNFSKFLSYLWKGVKKVFQFRVISQLYCF